MRSRFFAILQMTFITCVIANIFTGCGCEHDWKEASCTSAMSCAICGETQGEPLGHTWNEATCTAAKTCSVCSTTNGSAEEHEYIDGKCTVCGTLKASEGLGMLDCGSGYMVSSIGACTDKNIVVPSVFNGKPVIGITAGCFQHSPSLDSIVLPDSITIIGDYAFQDCSASEIVMSNSVTTVGYGALWGAQITSFVVPDGWTSIEDMFNYCVSLTDITIPASVTNIAYAFHKSAIENITYQGTIAQWKALVQNMQYGDLGNFYPAETVTCLDGTIPIFS